MKIVRPLFVFLLLLFSLPSFASEETSSPYRMGLVINYYDEPAFKPGGTLGLDWEIPLKNNWYGAVSLPVLGYFYYPDNYEAFYLYPEFSLRRIGIRGFYFSLSLVSGLSLSRKIVPVYNLEGEKIDDPFTKQLVMIVQLYFGRDFSICNASRPYRLYGSIGWKGLYPNNLGFQNQPMVQIGLNYRISQNHDD